MPRVSPVRTLLLLAIIAGPMVGCSNKLSKDEAQKLLSDLVVDKMSVPQCSVTIGKKKTARTYFDGLIEEGCADTLKSIGMISSAERPEYVTAATALLLTTTPAAHVDCDADGFCTARVDCGSATLVVDRISTTGSNATITYRIQRAVSDKASAAPKKCKVHLHRTDDETKEVTAQRDDDGHWGLRTK